MIFNNACEEIEYFRQQDFTNGNVMERNFKQCFQHYDGINSIGDLQDDSIYIYTTWIRKQKSDYPIALEILCNISPYFGTCVMDIRDVVFTDSEGIFDISFTHGDTEIPLLIYSTKKNILILRDYTHHKTGVEFFFVHLFPVLCKYLKVKKGKVKKQKLTIGSDPEFNFWRNGYYESAKNIIMSKYRINDSCELLERNCEIGTDGCSDTGELRPKQGSWFTHYLNISNLIKRMNTDFSQDIDVIGNCKPLGFHIHFGHMDLRYKPNLINYLIEALDYFLGSKFQHLNGRERSGYADLGNFEIKNYGFEYRSLPAIIMYDKRVLKIVLKLAYGLAEKILKDGKQVPFEIKTIEDIIGIKDKDYINDFTKKYSTNSEREKHQGKLLQNWKLRKGKIKRKKQSGVIFSDRDVFSDEFKRIVLDNKKFCKLFPYIFGLNNNRGRMIISVNIKCLEIKQHKVFLLTSNMDKNKIGFPYYIRVDSYTELFKQSQLEDFLNEIVNIKQQELNHPIQENIAVQNILQNNDDYDVVEDNNSENTF